MRNLFFAFLLSSFLPLFAQDIRPDIGPAPVSGKEPGLLSPENSRKAEAMADFAVFINKVFTNPNKKALPDSVVEKLYDVLEKDPSSQEVISLIAADLVDFIAKKQTRLQRLVCIAEKRPENLPLNLLAASLLAGKLKDKELTDKNTVQAINLLEHALEYAEDLNDEAKKKVETGGAYSLLALLYAAQKEFEKADDAISRGLKDVLPQKRAELLQAAMSVYLDALNKTSDQTPFLLGWLLDSDKEKFTKKFNEASREFTEILSSPENHLDSERFLTTAAIFSDKGKNDLALLIITAPLISSPGNQAALRRLAAFYYASNDFANAARAWKLVLEHKKEPHSYETFMHAASLHRSGNLQDAVKAFETHLKLAPQDQMALHQYALCLFLLRDYKKAVEAVDRIKTPRAESIYIKAISEEMIKEYSAALKSLQKFTSMKKFSGAEEKYPILLRTVIVADKANRHDVAAAILEPLIESDPDNAEMLNLLGYIYAEAGINLGTAEKLLLKAVELEPDNQAILDSVAWMYFRQKKYKEARIYIDKSLAASPKGALVDSVILEHAGDIYNALGEREKALGFWKKALEYYSEELKPENVLKKLEDASGKAK